MAALEIASVLAERARHANLTLPPSLSDQLLAYYRILVHWNRRINLTSLKDPVDAVDRLLLEPIAAARTMDFDARRSSLVDLGSGGGSPAVPLFLAIEAKNLVMVESRARKVAFLRTVARELNLNAFVESARFKEVAIKPEYEAAFDLVSARAVRIDDEFMAIAARLLRPRGRLLLLGAPASTTLESRFVDRGRSQLFNGTTLATLERIA